MQIKPVFQFLSIVLILSGSFIVSGVYAGEYDMLPVQQNRKALKLNGIVTSMKEQKYVLVKDTAIYNTVSLINLDDNFIVVRSEEASFDNIGNILSLKTSALVDAKRNRMKDSSRLFYYKNDKIIGIQNLSEGKRTDSFEFHYLKKGLLDYYRLFDVNGGVAYKMTYTYKNRKVFIIRKKDKGNALVAMIRCKYKDDKISEWQYYNDQMKNSETRRFAYKVNSEGNINESYSMSDANGILRGGLTVLKDPSGNVLEQSVVDSSRNVTAYFNYQYDDKQNKIKEKIYLGMEVANVENRYTYDSHNNWTKKEIFTNDVLTAVVTRSYNYGE